jgi:hypothetical protein
VKKPRIGAFEQFDQGRKHLFLEALDVFEAAAQWDDMYNFCHRALGSVDESGVPSFLASDLRVWKGLIASASRQPDDQA